MELEEPQQSSANISEKGSNTQPEKIDTSIENYRKKIKFHENELIDYLSQLAQVYQSQKQWSQAISCYRKITVVQPGNLQAYLKLGNALIIQGEFDEGLSSYIECLKLKPDCVEAYQKIYQRLHLPGHKISNQNLEKITKLYIENLKFIETTKKGWILPYLSIGNAFSDLEMISEAAKWYKVASDCQLKALKPKFVSKYGQLGDRQEPSFIIIGAMKCGTTSAYNYITQHPKVLPAVVKEVKFFNWNFHKGIEWYLSQFPCFPEGKGFLTGEASPNYLNSPEVPKRVFDYFPNMKLVIFLRNPIDRAISQYHHWVNLGTEKRSLEVAISSELDILEKITDFHPRAFKNLRHNHVGIGLYVYFIENWMKLFKPEQFLILQSDDLKKDPDFVMKNIFEFLDLPEHSCNRYKKHNSRAYAQIDSKLRSRLYNFFKPHNQKLETLLNRDFNWK